MFDRRQKDPDLLLRVRGTETFERTRREKRYRLRTQTFTFVEISGRTILLNDSYMSRESKKYSSL